MLFNSPIFLFAFLPLAWGLFLWLKRFSYGRGALAFICFASLLFYAWWDWHYVALLLASITVNYIVGEALVRRGAHKGLLVAGLAANLLCLGWFKYAAFFATNLNEALGPIVPVPHIILPLGISFYSFVQIAYIVDAYKGRAEKHSFIEYLSFVTFFPHLIAGPILDHKTIMPQFHALPARGYDWDAAARGLVLFAIGLFKKVMIADNFARYATPLFASVADGKIAGLSEAWMGALSYTLQLYFDFSGYSDMAIGLGLLFGIRLPENFLSPYKATSIIDFWRRWHITLSNFLKNYLYIPLGGSHEGRLRQYCNLLVTMLLGGLWHGAGWTYVVWGGLQGSYLVVNHAWRRVGRLPVITGWIVTMLAVVAGWVFFRSASLSNAISILQSMAGLHGLNFILPEGFGLLMLGFAGVLLLPNSMQIIAHNEGQGERRWYSYAPDARWAALTIILLSICLYTIVYNLNRISEFIYFQF